MPIKLFSLLILVGTIMAWTAWTMVVVYFNPEQAGILVFIVFYLSLLLSLAGSFYLISDWLKSKIFRRQLLLPRLRASIRHAIFLTLIIITWAILKSQGLLSWWALSLLILIFTVLEFFFISSHKNERPTAKA